MMLLTSIYESMADEMVLQEIEDSLEPYEPFYEFLKKVHPNEPYLYHNILNMGKLDLKTVAGMIVLVAQDSSRPSGFQNAAGESHAAIYGLGEPGKQ